MRKQFLLTLLWFAVISSAAFAAEKQNRHAEQQVTQPNMLSLARPRAIDRTVKPFIG
ncbi:MAG: hypothetical protein HY537_07310 [Deltaproteobacteria bacterium]|nr:hypothetical protein [Deltaproteobacteria bacterium]